ncbi:MAG: hypothetical protein R3E90_04285 [Marinicella sp.]
MRYFSALKTNTKKAAASQIGPKVYFRGIHRIHINRFKAYTNIFAGRLKDIWNITDNISEANVVATHQQNSSSTDIFFELYDSSPNLKPEPIDQFRLSFNEHEMVKQLNLASNKLKLAINNGSLDQNKSALTIHIACKPDVVAKDLCQRMNELNNAQPHIRFSHLSNTLCSSTIFVEHLTYVINPYEINSINGYYELEQRRKQDDLTIDQLTVIIVKHEDEIISEQIFDDVYSQSDESTQVTLLDITTDLDIKNFISNL